MPLLSLWDKGLSQEGPGEGKSHFLSLPSPYCLVGSVYRGSETLPERLYHLAKPVERVALRAHQHSDTGSSLLQGNPLPHPLSACSPACPWSLPTSNFVGKRGTAEASLHADKDFLLLEKKAESAEERHKAEHKISLVDFVASAPSHFGSIEWGTIFRL